MGLKPDEIAHMTLKEFNDYVYEYSYAKHTGYTTLAWQITNFVGTLLSGKFKDLKKYLPKRRDENKNTMLLSFREKKVLEAQKQAEILGHKI